MGYDMCNRLRFESADQSVELFQAAKLDSDLAGALLVGANLDVGAQAVGELFLQAEKVAIDRLVGGFLRRVGDLLDEVLGSADVGSPPQQSASLRQISPVTRQPPGGMQMLTPLSS